MPTPPRRPQASRLGAVLCTVALLAAGCSAVSSVQGDRAPAVSPTPSGGRAGSTHLPEPPRAMPPPPGGLQRFYRQDPSWRPCSDGFECTTVQVPLDYDHPSGDTVGLTVSRRPADVPSERAGAMLVNPGGPGAPGISYATSMAQTFRSDVTDRYDIVGFNPRGVDTSEGVECLTDAELDHFIAMDNTPDTPAAVDEARQALTRFGKGCVQGSGDLAGHVSTPEAARDMDIIRAVADSPRLNYYGASYGTLLGATYADLFPKRVGAMALDGAIDPSLSQVDSSVQQAAGFQRALDGYLRYCVRQDACPLGDTVPAAQSRLTRLLDDIDADPLPTSGARDLTIGNALYGVWLPLYVPQLYSALSASINAAIHGDGEGLLRLSDLYASRGPSGYQDNTFEALYAVNCLDEPGARSAAQIRRLVPRFEQASPVFGDVFAWGLLGCPGWPVHSAEPIPKIDAAGAPPIMVVGTTGDPATPYRSAVSLARQLRSGVLVTRVGDGHTGFNMGNACIDSTVNDFFAKGRVPEDGLRCG